MPRLERRTTAKICADDDSKHLQTLVLHLDAIPVHALWNRVRAAEDLGIRAGDNVLVRVCRRRGVPVHALELVQQCISGSQCAYAGARSGKRRWPSFSIARPHRPCGVQRHHSHVSTHTRCKRARHAARSGASRAGDRSVTQVRRARLGRAPGRVAWRRSGTRTWFHAFGAQSLFRALDVLIKRKKLIFFERAWTQETCSPRSSSSPAGMCARGPHHRLAMGRCAGWPLLLAHTEA